MTIRQTAASAGYGPTGQPFGAPYAVLVNGGTWVQRASLSITARTVGVSIEGTAATWDQQAAVEIDVPANGVAGDSHTGISLGANRATWNQRGTLVVRVGVGVGVRAGTTGMAQWNQTGDLTVAVDATLSTGPVDGVALGVGTLGEGAVWLQHGRAQVQVTATGIGAIGGGVALDANNNRHRWEQAGVLNVTALAQNGGLVRGVRIGQQSTTWSQAGLVLIDGTARTNGTVHGVVLGSAVWSANTWHQSGPLDIRIVACADGPLAPTVPSAAIRGTSRCGTWRSTDAVDLRASSGLCSVTSAYPLWLDSHGCNFTLDRAAAIQGGPVRCDTAPAAPSPVGVRGLPLGTPVQGFPFFSSSLSLPSFSPRSLQRLSFPLFFCSSLFFSLISDRHVQRPGAPARGRPRVGRRRQRRGRLAEASHGQGARLGDLCRLPALYPVGSAERAGQRYAVCLSGCAPTTAFFSLCVSFSSPLPSPVAHTKVLRGMYPLVQAPAAFCPARWLSIWLTARARSASRVSSISRPPMALCWARRRPPHLRFCRGCARPISARSDTLSTSTRRARPLSSCPKVWLLFFFFFAFSLCVVVSFFFPYSFFFPSLFF